MLWKKVRQITGRPIKFINGDVRDREAILSCLKTCNIDVVIHFAGLKAVSESTDFPLEYFENNVSGSINLISCMKEVGIKILIFSSSATVYGEPGYLPYDEHHPLRPNNVYGKTKLAVENLLTELCASDTNWRVTCLRYFNPVGAHVSGLIGDNPKGVLIT